MNNEIPLSVAEIYANCSTKICMRIEDPYGTFERFLKPAGLRMRFAQGFLRVINNHYPSTARRVKK